MCINLYRSETHDGRSTMVITRQMTKQTKHQDMDWCWTTLWDYDCVQHDFPMEKRYDFLNMKNSNYNLPRIISAEDVVIEESDFRKNDVYSPELQNFRLIFCQDSLRAIRQDWWNSCQPSRILSDSQNKGKRWQLEFMITELWSFVHA